MKTILKWLLAALLVLAIIGAVRVGKWCSRQIQREQVIEAYKAKGAEVWFGIQYDVDTGNIDVDAYMPCPFRSFSPDVACMDALRNDVSVDDFRQLQRFEELQVLYFNAKHLNKDKVVEIFDELPFLVKVTFSNPPFTNEEADFLRQRYPNVKFHFWGM